MSHLAKRQNKQFVQRFFIALVLIIAFIIFFFSAGIKLLVSFTLFLNQMANGKSKQQAVQQQQTLSSITIDPILSATNSAVVDFSGTSLNFDHLEIYLNDEKQDEISISDSFAGEIKNLQENQNTIYFIAKSASSKETKKTQEFTVTYMKSKPKLEVSSPSDNSKTNKEDVAITGTTDKEITILVNGQPVIVDVDGKFVTSVRLKNGENKITISAEDVAGNEVQKTLTVTYSKDD